MDNLNLMKPAILNLPFCEGLMEKYRHIIVQPISGSIGADIYNVDISQPLGKDVFKELEDAFLKYLVICIRDQKLDPSSQLNFAKLFGEPMIYPFVKGLPEYPQVTPVVKEKTDTINFGGLWHSDTSYEKTPPLGTMLYARELPPYGGDTEFANMYLAYETLYSYHEAAQHHKTEIHLAEAVAYK